MNGVPPNRSNDLGLETLRVLMARRLAPTPDNYRAVYSELTGRSAPKTHADLALDALANRLTGLTQSKPLGDRLAHGLRAGAWPDIEQILSLLAVRANESVQSKQQLEIERTRHAAEVARLREPFDEFDALRTAGRLVADLIQHWFGQQLQYAPQLSGAALSLRDRAAQARRPDDFDLVGRDLADFLHQAESAGHTLDQMFRSLLSLMQLLIQHVRELGSPDRLVDRHTSRLQLVLQDSLTPESLKNAEITFREFLDRQTELQQNVEQSKSALRELVGVLLDRLGTLSDDTTGFGDRIGSYADKLADAEDLSELSTLVNDLVTDARAMQKQVVNTQGELLAARQQVHDYEARIESLRAEVEAISELVREDQLTGALNRRGLGQAFCVEAARCDRKNKPLSVAILDIDNFKKLNDSLGHKAGDDALVHLATVVRQLVRPSDAVARYGGEEFVILLPETTAEEAVGVMDRVQRELTKRFFLHNHERVFITFSAGVAQRRLGEPQDEVVDRADKAMYRAKRTGKNRVECAESQQEAQPGVDAA